MLSRAIQGTSYTSTTLALTGDFKVLGVRVRVLRVLVELEVGEEARALGLHEDGDVDIPGIDPEADLDVVKLVVPEVDREA